MSIKLTDTQIVMLSAAAQRDDRCLVAPRNLKGGAAQKVATKLIGGWPREGDQGEARSAGVAARRASRPILCVEANGGGRPGDRRSTTGLASDDNERRHRPARAGHYNRLSRSSRPLPTFLQPPQACPRPEAARSWRGSSNCFSAIVAQR